MLRRNIVRRSVQDRVNRALAKYGILEESIAIVTHRSRRAYLGARRSANYTENTGRMSSRILLLLSRTAISGMGFTNFKSHEVHLEERAGAVVRLHEYVHGHDINQQVICDLVRTTLREEKKITLRKPIEYIKFKLKEIRVLAILEGRAKFCETMACKDEEFTFLERLRFKTSKGSEATVLALTTVLVAWEFANTMQFPLSVLNIVDALAIALGTWISVKLTPYVLGLRFMEHVEQKTKDARNTLKITAEKLPTLREILRPKEYIRRIAEA